MCQISLCDSSDGASHFCCGSKKIFDERVHRDFDLSPSASGFMKARTLPGSAFLANRLANTFQLLCHLLIGGDDLVESVGNLTFQTCPRTRQAHGEIAVTHGLETSENYRKAGTFRPGYVAAVTWRGMRGLFLSCSRESIRASFHVRRLATSKISKSPTLGASLSASIDRMRVPEGGRPIVENERNSGLTFEHLPRNL